MNKQMNTRIYRRMTSVGVLCIALLGSVVFLTGCDDVNAHTVEGENRNILPINAKVEKDLGNGWLVFSIEGRQYIYRMRNKGANSSTEVLAPF